MSAKDDLDRLDNEWNRHLQWRKGQRMSLGHEVGPGRYRDDGHHSGLGLRLTELPAPVRDRFLAEIEALVGAALDNAYHAERQRLVALARDEAKRTLAELE